MRAHLKLYCRNETEYWPPMARRQAGHGIFRTYMFDSLQKGHCQESTLSYQLWPLYTTLYENAEVFDAPSNLYLMEDNSHPTYVYCWRLDRLPPTSFHDCGETVLNEGTDYSDFFAEQHDRYVNERPLTIPHGIKIPKIHYEFSPLLTTLSDLTTEEWRITFLFHGTDGPVRTRPRDTSQQDLGLIDLEQWVLLECARRGFDGARIEFVRPPEATHAPRRSTWTV